MGVHVLGPVGGPLPRGRKDLSRAEVLASQRGRMLAAVTEAVAEKGYAAATVTDVITRARVSRSTFYASFANKEECFTAAYEAATGFLAERVSHSLSAEPGSLRAALHAGMRTYCDLLAAHRATARALIVESAASPALRAARARTFAVWACLLQDRAPQAPPMAGTATVGAITHLLACYLEEDTDLSTVAEVLTDTAYRLLCPSQAAAAGG